MRSGMGSITGSYGVHSSYKCTYLQNAPQIESCRCLRVLHRGSSTRRRFHLRALNEERSSQAQSPRSYAARLQSIPAYQRLKALKQQPTQAGESARSQGNAHLGLQVYIWRDPAEKPQSPAVAKEPEQTVPSLKPREQTVPPPKPQEQVVAEEQVVARPQAGLEHRQRNRPVGQQSLTSPVDGLSGPRDASQAASSQRQSAAPAPPQLSARSPLQPLSALQKSPYASEPAAPTRHADFAESSPPQQKATSTVQFWLTFHAEFGQKLRVVGSHKNLGSWIMVEGPELKWTEGDRWHAEITLPSGSVYEYKYVLLDSSGTHALTWQRGNNSVLAIKQDEAELEVFDNWEGQPGAAVMSGGKSSTRETKLLAWATDIESQLALQRQELRRTRIDLAAAQEDARKARQEARAVRMELAQSQSIRAQADKLIRELQSSNRLLKSELQATTTSFKQALHAAQTMLDTAEERDLETEIETSQDEEEPQEDTEEEEEQVEEEKESVARASELDKQAGAEKSSPTSAAPALQEANTGPVAVDAVDALAAAAPAVAESQPGPVVSDVAETAETAEGKPGPIASGLAGTPPTVAESKSGSVASGLADAPPPVAESKPRSMSSGLAGVSPAVAESKPGSAASDTANAPAAVAESKPGSTASGIADSAETAESKPGSIPSDVAETAVTAEVPATAPAEQQSNQIFGQGKQQTSGQAPTEKQSNQINGQGKQQNSDPSPLEKQSHQIVGLGKQPNSVLATAEKQSNQVAGQSKQQSSIQAAANGSTDTAGVVASGMQGQALESATSSNARQQSTVTTASPNTSSVSGLKSSASVAGKPPTGTSGPARAAANGLDPSAVMTSKPQLGEATSGTSSQDNEAEEQPVGGRPKSRGRPKSPSDGPAAKRPGPRGKAAADRPPFRNGKAAAKRPATQGKAAADSPDEASKEAEFPSQPQLTELPKHGKPEHNQESHGAAAPPQAPGTFPDSQGPLEYFETQKEDQSSGTQLETSRTAVPAPPAETNEAASQAPVVEEEKNKPADQESGPGTPAGKELEVGKQAIPDKPDLSKPAATAAQRPWARPANGKQNGKQRRNKNGVPNSVSSAVPSTEGLSGVGSR